MQGKSYFVHTFGCQMNVHDSEQLAGMLERAGYRRAAAESEADVYLLNTCSVRGKAEQKLFTKLGRVRELKRSRPGMVIGVCGCIAQREGEEIFRRAPYVDLVLGPRALASLPALLREVRERGAGQCCLEASEEFEEGSVFLRNSAVIGYVTIMEGCDNFCSYCIVPYVRGREISRPCRDIMKEVRYLAAEGYQEVQLLGQNVNSYRDKRTGVDFAELLHRVAQVKEFRRIRFITSHPKDLCEEVIRVMAEHGNICNAVHLPPQSGSDRVLKAMNRGYTRDEYLEKTENLKYHLKEIALSGDIIAGFPGETDDDFKQTLDLVRQVGFSQLFTFVFSPRPGTAAARFSNGIPREVKVERLQQLQALQNDIQLSNHRKMVGSVLEVLIEGPSARGGGQVSGRTGGNHLVNIDASEEHIGKFLPVEITRAGTYSLRGRICGSLDKGGAVALDCS